MRRQSTGLRASVTSAQCKPYALSPNLVVAAPKSNSLASNLTRLTSKCIRGRKQGKQSLTFVFWSTRRRLFAAIKHEQMHPQRETRLAVPGAAGAALMVNGLFTPSVNPPRPRAHTQWHQGRPSGGADLCFLAHITLWQRLLRERSGRCKSSVLLAENPADIYFFLPSVIQQLFSRAKRKIADKFAIFQPLNHLAMTWSSLKTGSPLWWTNGCLRAGKLYVPVTLCALYRGHH